MVHCTWLTAAWSCEHDSNIVRIHVDCTDRVIAVWPNLFLTPPFSTIIAQGGTDWAPAAIIKPSTTSLQPLFICNKPACALAEGSYATSCTTCVACPPKQCPSGQQLQVAGCSATSGGECVDCAFFNATWGGAACVCIANLMASSVLRALAVEYQMKAPASSQTACSLQPIPRRDTS